MAAGTLATYAWPVMLLPTELRNHTKAIRAPLQLQALRNTTEGGEHHISSVANGTSTAHTGLRIPLSLLLHLLWHPAQQSQPVALPDLHSP